MLLLKSDYQYERKGIGSQRLRPCQLLGNSLLRQNGNGLIWKGKVTFL
jgi:hypothetical protein